jgi:GR25 family glycosyltransferase involved in LPS biosynthesis
MIHINSFVDKIYCINLKSRKDRKKLIQKQAKKYNLNINFFSACKDKQGWKGCLKSHLNILKEAKNKKLDKILIMEDDCKILQKLEFDIDKIPKQWKMLYLGCNLVELLEDNHFEAKNKKWVKMKSYTTHCIIIHNTAYDELINLITPMKKPIDVYYMEDYHENKECFAINPMIATQQDGYSDIENKFIKYHLKDIDDVIHIRNAPYTHNKETGEFKLHLNNIEDTELPYISILTPTKNRSKLFPFAIYCFQNIIYPHHKIEWIIVDDSDDDNLYNILPKDNRIKYYKINTKKKLTVSMKRNLCVKYSSYDILVNMDDDDYYLPYNILARVKTLMSYPEIDVVGCCHYCCYNVYENTYCLVGTNTNLSEASMAFRKKFWKDRNFNNKLTHGEGADFLKNRKKNIYKIPYDFIFFAINHQKNLTGNLRKSDKLSKVKYHSFPDHILKMLNKIYNI